MGRMRLGSVHPRMVSGIGERGLDFLRNIQLKAFAIPNSNTVSFNPVFSVLTSDNCRNCILMRTRRSPTGTGPFRCTLGTEGCVTRGTNLWFDKNRRVDFRFVVPGRVFCNRGTLSATTRRVYTLNGGTLIIASPVVMGLNGATGVASVLRGRNARCTVFSNIVDRPASEVVRTNLGI